METNLGGINRTRKHNVVWNYSKAPFEFYTNKLFKWIYILRMNLIFIFIYFFYF